MSAFDKVVVAAALLLVAISLLSPGGFVVGVTLAVLLLLAVYGSKYLLKLEESRRMGEKGRQETVRDRLAGGDSERWDR